MTGYFIDGYNLLFRVLQGGENLQQERQQLIKELERKLSLLKLPAVIVFDSQYQPDEGSVTHLKWLEIIFTAQGETADEYILQRLKDTSNSSQAHSKQTCVVTSDKKLAWLCRKRLAKVESVEEFTALLNRRVKNKQKEKAKAFPASPSTQETAVPKKAAPPQKHASAEECSNYYLDAFEKAYKETSSASTPLPAPTKAQKRLMPPVPAPEEQALSEMERWQHLFERKLKE
jgi:uncharacterized protein